MLNSAQQPRRNCLAALLPFAFLTQLSTRTCTSCLRKIERGKDALNIRLLSRKGKVLCVERCYAREGRSSLVFAFGLAFAFGWMGEGRKSTEREMGGPSVRREGLELDEITGEVCKEGGGGVFPLPCLLLSARVPLLPSDDAPIRPLASPPAIEDARPADAVGGRRARAGVAVGYALSRCAGGARERGGGTVAKALSLSRRSSSTLS